jgi:hypothetical protein
MGEDVGELLVVAVEIGDGHDPVDSRPHAGDLTGGGDDREKDKGQQQEKQGLA